MEILGMLVFMVTRYCCCDLGRRQFYDSDGDCALLQTLDAPLSNESKS